MANKKIKFGDFSIWQSKVGYVLTHGTMVIDTYASLAMAKAHAARYAVTHGMYNTNPRSKRGNDSSVRSPTRTSTSTRANTTGNRTSTSTRGNTTINVNPRTRKQVLARKKKNTKKGYYPNPLATSPMKYVVIQRSAKGDEHICYTLNNKTSMALAQLLQKHAAAGVTFFDLALF